MRIPQDRALRLRMYQAVKRLFDIAASLLALAVLSPILLIAAVGIEISDPGPVFYMANRVGKGGKAFRMLKFRSMRVDNSADEKSFKADTNRIFRWGAIMRSTKIDELPQLVNILLGDMSIIGPRPASVDQAHITRGGRYAAVDQLQPGLSGPSALYDYIYGDTIEDEAEYEKKVLKTRLDLDLVYLQRMSAAYDLKMIWYTVVCVVSVVFGKQPQWMLQELVEAAASVNE